MAWLTRNLILNNSTEMVYKVCVVGAGVIGLSSAYNIQRDIPNVEVTVIADKFSPDTTADGTAGLLMPYLAGNTPVESVSKWFITTWDYLIKILRSPDADAAGVSLHCGSLLFEKKPQEDPMWKDVVFNYKPFTKRELDTLYPGYDHGVHFGTLFCMCQRYLPWLMQRYKAIGGKVTKQSLSSLTEIADMYDVIVVCPGVRARQLVDDEEVYPIRGQLVTMKSLWNNPCLVLGERSSNSYILPGTEYIHCGGTAQANNWNEQSDPEDVKGIIERCTKLVPSLKNAEVVSTWAGLRPARSSVRLEKEDRIIGANNKKVVYNYGHGGSGVTLHWGCALEATELVKQSILELQSTRPSSKL